MSEYAGIEKPRDGVNRIVGFTDALTPGGIKVQVRTTNVALDPGKPTQEESEDGPYETTALWLSPPERDASVARYGTVAEAISGHDDAAAAFEDGSLTVTLDGRALFKVRAGCGHIGQVFLPVAGETLASFRAQAAGTQRCLVCGLLSEDPRAYLDEPNPYFGAPWASGVCDEPDSHQVETPVGQPCGWCQVPIQDGDQGIVIPGPEGPVGHHRECMIAGTVGHSCGQCGCTEGQQTPAQRRQMALDVWAQHTAK